MQSSQIVEDGCEFFAKRQLVTLFSASNYCGHFDNGDAMMSVELVLCCSCEILKPSGWRVTSMTVSAPKNK
ncbi:hypothetical protein MRX96_001300 [Rhipicephalus microplus]